MINVEQLKRQKAEKVAEIRTVLATVEAQEDKAFTAEQEARHEALEKEVSALNTLIERGEKIAAEEAREALATPAVITDRAPDTEESGGYRSFHEFFQEVRNGGGSSRLKTRAISMGDNAQVGYMVPDLFSSTFREVEPNEAIIRPRCEVLPPSADHPDATIHLVALDQSGAKGINSGVSIKWSGETTQRVSAGDPTVRRVSLSPYIADSYIDMSNMLLDNSETASNMVRARLRTAVIMGEESVFMSGDGSSKPKGYIGDASNVTVTRKTAASITYKDIVTMESLTLGGLFGGEGYIWVVAKSAKPTLRQMKDAAGNLIWQNSARIGEPDTLLGYPIYFTEFAPGVGTTGDIMLVNLRAYVIRDGSPLAIFVDPYSRREYGQTRIYGSFRVDGKPWLTAPIKGEDGVDRSAFIKLSTLTA